VLVAEDEARLADLLQQSLEEAGWDVDVVPDGPAAYRAVTRRRTTC